MFGRKKASTTPSENPIAAPAGYSDVYVMPEKYVVETAKGSGKGFWIAAIILIAVILLTVSYLIYDNLNRQPTTVTPEITPPQIEEVIETESATEIATTTLEMATTTALVATTTTSTSTAAAQTPTVMIPSLDSDNDGLTDIEETLLGTLPSNPDTDGDGYRDGVEVAAGYNPTKPGSSRLNESPFITSLTTNFNADNFKILYPKDWQVSFINSGKQVLLTASTGEIIRISVKDNQLGQSVLAWYLQDHPDAVVSQLKVIESGSLSGIYTSNGLTAYLTDAGKTKFYVFEYLSGQQTELRYPTVFAAIIKSLTPIASVSQPAGAATTSVAQVCAGYLCYEEPCGPLVSGENSCLSAALKKTCYDRTCSSDANCPSGQICVEISCWRGDEAEIAKVCK